jgi:hypothetical protein
MDSIFVNSSCSPGIDLSNVASCASNGDSRDINFFACPQRGRDIKS